MVQTASDCSINRPNFSRVVPLRNSGYLFGTPFGAQWPPKGAPKTIRKLASNPIAFGPQVGNLSGVLLVAFNPKMGERFTPPPTRNCHVQST